MSTFCAVDDTALIRLIQNANNRIVYIAPGVHEPVAKALKQRSEGGMFAIDITVILDTDEDVCRIGYGDAEGLKLLGELAKSKGEKDIVVRNQPGLRVGVLLADEKMMVWSPTPRSVEAPPNSTTQKPSNDSVQPLAPNGLLLGMNPGKEVADAITAAGTDSDAGSAEIGKAAVTTEQVQEAVTALENNPPVPVDLALITRVFSTKLQFVELTVKGAQISRSQLKVPSILFNADAKGYLRDLIENKLHAFADLRDREIDVPAFDKSDKRVVEPVTEGSLQRRRYDIERDFIFDIVGYGRLIEKDTKAQFEKQVEAYKEQLIAHSEGIRKLLDEQASQILDDALELIMTRQSHAAAAGSKDKQELRPEQLRRKLQYWLDRAKAEPPVVTLVYKDVTYQQTQDDEFRKRVNKALPPPVRRKLGNWDEHFKAAKADSHSQMNNK